MYIISGVYKIQSKVHPNRFYIGSAISIRNRWLLHLADLRKNKHHSSKLQNHFNKYGEEDLVFIILELCFPEFAVVREQYYIDTLKPFFNCSPTACSNLGIKFSDQARRNMSKAKLGKPCPTKGIKRKKMTPEFCKNQSERMKENSRNKGKHWKWTEEQKEKLRGKNNHFFGKHHTIESINKSKKNHSGQTPWNKGIEPSRETKKKISDSLKGNIPWNKGMSKLKNAS